MESAAKRTGFTSISEYLRTLHEAEKRRCATAAPPHEADTIEAPEEFFRVGKGRMLWGDSRGMLRGLRSRSVDLIMTSPPFGLLRKKSYGNEDADQYVNWFREFAVEFRRVLKESGSLVIDIGGAWNKGLPTRSLYHFELLISLCREHDFHLCEEHYWWNPTKLPTPAEWVNIRRIRVKDAVNCVWWLSPTPWPKADNRRVLAPYSPAMNRLLRDGYHAKLRPSGHDISDKFQRNNGGSVPPNLLAIANTESQGRYQQYCRDNDLPIHPARFPSRLPEYFIRLLTDRGDLVVDPFAGSCVTGAAAEDLGRKWICCEQNREYLEGAVSRFQPTTEPARSPAEPRSYAISQPCSIEVDHAPRRLGTGKTGPASV